MRILITGGAGFLGSHLADRFLAEGHSVIVLDNLITGSTENIKHLAGRDDFLFVKHDVTHYIYVGKPVDAILHFASPASPIDYLKYPIQTLKVGALGTHNALGVALHKDARFLLASTSEIYGDPPVSPQDEETPHNPMTPYGVSKLAGELSALTITINRGEGTLGKLNRSPEPYNKLISILNRADRAMYAAKAAGRNCVFSMDTEDRP